MRRVYLDNNATTCAAPEVVDAVGRYLRQDYGNASSIHTLGQAARAAVEQARQQVAQLVGGSAGEIIFTSGGTEADNLAVLGMARARSDRGRHILTSRIEHPAVLRSCEQLEREGFRVTRLPVTREGLLDPEAVEAAIEADTILISIMHANNEVGSIQPLEEIAERARRHDLLFHSDAVQTVGKIPVDVRSLGVDALSLSGHKFHGPKGVGALWVRKGVPLEPLLWGGSHERGLRAGTENVPGIAGLGVACQLALEALPGFASRVGTLRDRLEGGILASVPGALPNGSHSCRVPHVANISFTGIEGDTVLIGLDFQGIAVSTGAACSSGSLRPSHVLEAMKLKPEQLQGAIRFSLSRFTRAEDIDFVLEVLPPMLQKMREMSFR